MTVKIDKKIKKFSFVKDEDKTSTTSSKNNYEQMSETIKRPEFLQGSTYKIKPPQAEDSLYVTINDIVLNKGGPHEMRRPFEIFLSSKNMEHFQWTVALTLIISAVFRKGGDITFLVEELRSVFDPNGGYLKKGGKYIPSLVSEIGDTIETHLISIGMLPEKAVKPKPEAIKPKEKTVEDIKDKTKSDASFPAEAQICSKCMTKALMRLDGCMTCLNCGYSKCG